jgi:hypothetical protein
MKFLLDENFPKAAIAFLESAGHQVFDFRRTGDEGIDERQGPTSGRSVRMKCE